MALNSVLVLKTRPTPTETPDAGFVYLWQEGTSLSLKDSTGATFTLSTGITAEQVQDIVGALFVDSSTIDFVYDDVANTMTGNVIQSAISHLNISNVGTNTHAQIDSHIASTANPHNTTKTQVGLSNVPNVDATNPANIVQTASFRFVTDTEKATWNAKEPAIAAGTITQYWRGDKTFQTLDKATVGLSNVQNLDQTNPANIVQTATFRFVTDTEKATWNGKENSLGVGTINQYLRGDKTFQTLDKAAVGLGNVDNTSDLNKPISTATQVALNAKYDASNPLGFETPAQLNTRDTNNRSRANHTGTQLAATISDFAATVRSTVLTGLSLATNAATVATDSVLQAFGKLQAQIDGHFGQGGTAHATATTSAAGFMSATDKVKLDGLTNDVVLENLTTLNNTSNVTNVQIPNLTINAVAGRRYVFEVLLRFQTAATGTGITFGFGGTSTGVLAASVNAIVTTPGTNALFSGALTAINGVVTTSGVQTANTPFICRTTGIFVATTSGTFIPQFRSEVNGSQVSALNASFVTYKAIT